MKNYFQRHAHHTKFLIQVLIYEHLCKHKNYYLSHFRRQKKYDEKNIQCVNKTNVCE